MLLKGRRHFAPVERDFVAGSVGGAQFQCLASGERAPSCTAFTAVFTAPSGIRGDACRALLNHFPLPPGQGAQPLGP